MRIKRNDCECGIIPAEFACKPLEGICRNAPAFHQIHDFNKRDCGNVCGSAAGSRAVDEWEAGSHDVTSPMESARSGSRGLRVHPIVLIAAIVVVVLVLVGLLPRPQLPGPGSGGPPASSLPSGAPIVGLTILSPTDGQAVAAKDVLVIGLAPPGLSVTQDISFGFDQHATADGTGHWAIKVGLNEGDNKLTFRIGDDHSTQQTIRVIYTPPASP